MTRELIPKKSREAILAEYNHRCSICGSDRPQIHHVDEDHANNSIENLLPLCPNCHLRDQHNPTKKYEISKLKLFRFYKDPTILKPQFHPIYIRLLFLDLVQPGEESISELEKQATELIEFAESLEMGQFYGKRLRELIGPLRHAFFFSLGGGPDPNLERQIRAANRDFRDKLITNRNQAIATLVEQLRFQTWSHDA